MKPFPKTPTKIVTLTIDENGDQVFLKTDSADIFLEQGEVITRRASHVEPATFWRRLAFSVLRRLFPDTSRVAAWTRTWSCLWRVNTSPVGGPILTIWDATGGHVPSNRIMTWADRQSAIDAEVQFLNHWFAERTIQ